ncbi:2,3-bisphosphoglycerate-independent phosphoglycerate mutase [Candidatus Microgenomates bacterium]|nr:2,3-bisphosphoglycerate-independent phosphoglycerate mutase [Candidatus Microgenomates bacterium]
MTKPKFVILAILDGWGLTAPSTGNAISQASTINMDKLWASYPHTQLDASGEAVGLIRGQAGNTETGHINLGAGRVIYQDLARIGMSIAEGTFYKNEALLGAIEHAKKNNSNLHLMGLVGAGGVHSNIEHLFALIHLCAKHNFDRVFLHLFTDGRDSPPTAAKTYVQRINEIIQKEKVGTIASIMGRYWALDRDFRWERTEKAYLALTTAKADLVKSCDEAIDASYNSGKTDEFIEPALISNQEGKPVAIIKDNDSVIFFNFRVDRPRQLTSAFVVEQFDNTHLKKEVDPYLEKYEKTHLIEKVKVNKQIFTRGEALKNLYFATMTEYSPALKENGTKVAYPPEIVEMPLGRIIAENGSKQLHASESEKERFVTFYFNGLHNQKFEGEDRLIVPSPKVATYDLMPEMSAKMLTELVIKRLQSNLEYKFVIINYANVDMVGHTGNIGAALKACQVADEEIGKLANYVLAYNGALIITADHGNTEEMIDQHTGQIDTEHNANPVPFIAVHKDFMGKSQTLQSGILADVAPSILNLLGLTPPTQMTGRDLLKGII